MSNTYFTSKQSMQNTKKQIPRHDGLTVPFKSKITSPKMRKFFSPVVKRNEFNLNNTFKTVPTSPMNMPLIKLYAKPKPKALKADSGLEYISS